MLRTLSAGSGAAGTFRASILFDWFSTSNFLCNSSTPCNTPTHQTARSDTTSHYGATVGLSVTPVDYLEGFIALRSYSNSNDQWVPGVLQVLGDTSLGLKAFTPARIGDYFTFGGSAELLLLNGIGGVGLSGKGTGARFKLIGSADFRKPHGEGTPLRIHTNIGYWLDNSGALVEDTEAQRDTHLINRIERFGLGINRVDEILFNIGVEIPLPHVRPFLEWEIGIPANRQGYVCDPVRSLDGDQCLGVDKTFSAVPSRLTAGVRVYPWLKGLSLTGAIEAGTGATSNFLEEIAPIAPWDLWFGLGYAFDTVEPPPKPVIVERTVAVAPPERHIRGFVHERDKADGIANAIVRWEGLDRTAMATGPDGRFVSANVDPGTYKFSVLAEGYNEGKCSITVPATAPSSSGPNAGAANAASPAGATAPGTTAPGATAAPGMPAAPGAPAAPATPGAPATAPGGMAPAYFEVDCPLEPLPRTGNLVGRVIDADGQTPIPTATMHVTDAQGRDLQAPLDASGAFRVEALPPGTTSIRVEADSYMVHVQTADIKPREDTNVEVLLHKSPGLVKLGQNEIRIKQQVHFETDSAKILGDSSALLEEIADTIIRHPEIHRIEIQGHTDNSGTADHNKMLSEQRAEAVRSWLVEHGVEPSRLTARGFGQDRPIAPNSSAAGMARNRRVQFIITEREGAAKPDKTAPAAPSTGTPGGNKGGGAVKKPVLPF